MRREWDAGLPGEPNPFEYLLSTGSMPGGLHRIALFSGTKGLPGQFVKKATHI